jgi:hypothetical protein
LTAAAAAAAAAAATAAAAAAAVCDNRDSDLAGTERQAAIDRLQQEREQLQLQGPGQQRQLPQLFHLADKGLWTKLRPGVAAFLAAVSPLYELHIYTMGDKGYAGLMADLLDPQHRLFVGRVISAVSSSSSSSSRAVEVRQVSFTAHYGVECWAGLMLLVTA